MPELRFAPAGDGPIRLLGDADWIPMYRHYVRDVEQQICMMCGIPKDLLDVYVNTPFTEFVKRLDDEPGDESPFVSRARRALDY